MIATLSRRSLAAHEQWNDPRRRARLLAAQINAAERRRVDRLVNDHLHLLEPAGGAAAHLTGIDKADMMQAAYLGLRRAAETFDPTKRAAFGTWAYWQMKAACQEERFRMRSTIRYPRYPRSPIPKCSSLDVDSDDGATIRASVADEQAEDPIGALDRAELRDALACALGTLAPRDALVVEMRFGLNGAERPHSFTEIGDRLGLSATRTLQLLTRGLEQLRETLAHFAT